jgi:hypothetical protein
LAIEPPIKPKPIIDMFVLKFKSLHPKKMFKKFFVNSSCL